MFQEVPEKLKFQNNRCLQDNNDFKLKSDWEKEEGEQREEEQEGEKKKKEGEKRQRQ